MNGHPTIMIRPLYLAGLLALLGGVLRPERGRITLQVEGRSVELGGLSDRERDRLRVDHIGFVFQQYNLLPSLSAAENVAVAIAAVEAFFGDAFPPQRVRDALAAVESPGRLEIVRRNHWRLLSITKSACPKGGEYAHARTSRPGRAPVD